MKNRNTCGRMIWMNMLGISRLLHRYILRNIKATVLRRLTK